MQTEAGVCPICGGPASVAATKDDTPLFNCAACAFRFFPLHEEAPEQLYATEYFVGEGGEYGDYSADEPSHRRMARRYLRRIAAVGQRRPGLVLDVGCATGFFLDEARKAGWGVQGIEVSEYASNAARARGIPVVQGSFSVAELPPTRYDAVTFFNSLEHIPDPRQVGERLAQVVKPGGLVVIETWDWRSAVALRLGLSWHQYDPRHVVSYFSEQAMRSLFKPPRWEVVRYGKAIKWISARRALDILQRKHSMPVPGVQEWLRLMDVPYLLGDLVWAVVRKAN